MRHATPRNTLDTYGHLWPDADAYGGRRVDRRPPRVKQLRCVLTAYCAFHGSVSLQFSALAVLYVVVERELVGVRPDLNRQDLVLALEVDPRLDQVGRENASLGEVFVVTFQAVDHR
jgi:hypothetical protein